MEADRYGFYINTSVCSGCKTCQVACKDKNNLAPGQQWRRVYEVEGGTWGTTNGAWSNLPYSYNISISCNHCSDPECVKACPTTAMHTNEMGIVVVDHEKCIGCGYCRWACPYEAPRLDPDSKMMTKCDMCHDELMIGGIPSCVEACPMRALDFGMMESLNARYGTTKDIYPLPRHGITQPNMVVKPHKDSEGAESDSSVAVVNREEV